MWLWLVGLALAQSFDGASLQQASAAWKAQRVARGAPTIPASAYASAAAGEVAYGVVDVEGSNAKKTWGVTILDQPIQRVWGAINDESLHSQYTSLSYAEVVRGRACESGRHVLQYLPVSFPGISDRWWIVIRNLNSGVSGASGGKARELVWESTNDTSSVTSTQGKTLMAEGVPVAFTKGSWYLVEIAPGRTLVEYYTWVDPGGSLSPSALTMFAGRTIRTTMEAMGTMAKDSRLKCTGG